jgi:alpha-tubulin suppressor-like RCC1 family protein
MGDRFPGGVISKTPPTVTPPVNGEGGSASGLWSLAEQFALEKAGSWPGRVLPRELYAWGRQFGIGDNTLINRSSPVQIGTLTNWAQVSAGGAFTAAVTTNGQLYAWGRNTSGQIGDNTAGFGTYRSSPVQIGALTNWAQVSAGGEHTAAVKTDGTMWAWGFNNQGQLGDGTVFSPRSSPVQIGAFTTWSQVSVGGNSSVAITASGQLYAWGQNGVGQLGDGTVVNRSAIAQIGILTNWSRVSMGGVHTVAVKTDGTLWAWGFNYNGTVGDNTSGPAANKSSPVQIGGLTNWSLVSAGNNHTAAVTTSNQLYAWGRNNYGQLGQNNTTNRSSPTQVGALTNWSQVSAGGDFLVSIKTDGTLWAWGRNQYSQLGQNNTTNRSSPVQVGALTNWFQVSAGAEHVAATTRG